MIVKDASISIDVHIENAFVLELQQFQLFRLSFVFDLVIPNSIFIFQLSFQFSQCVLLRAVFFMHFCGHIHCFNKLASEDLVHFIYMHMYILTSQ